MDRNDIYVLSKVRKVLKNKLGADGGRSMVLCIWLGPFKAGSQSEHRFIFSSSSIL